MPDSPIDVLIKYKQRILDAVTESLDKNDKVASAGLRQSAEVQYVIFTTEVSLILYMNSYWKFVEEGVDGTQVRRGSPYKFTKKNINQKAMLKHIADRGDWHIAKVKSIQKEYKDKDGKIVQRKKPLPADRARKTLAFLIGRQIAQKGIKPTHFVDEALYQSTIIDELTEDLSEALGREIELNLQINK